MQAGAKPRRAPAAKGEQRGGQGTRAHTPACSQLPRWGGTLLQTLACAKGTPWQDPGGWEPLCFLSFKLQYSLKGEGGICVVLLLPLHLMAGFA